MSSASLPAAERKQTNVDPSQPTPSITEEVKDIIKEGRVLADRGSLMDACVLLKRLVRRLQRRLDVLAAESPQPQPSLDIPLVTSTADDQPKTNASSTVVASPAVDPLEETTQLLATVLNNLACYLKADNKIGLAIAANEEAHSLEVGIGRPSTSTMLNLCVLYTSNGQYQFAIESADSAIVVIQGSDDPDLALWAAILHNKAVAAMHLLTRFGEGSPSSVYATLQEAAARARWAGKRGAAALERINATSQRLLEAFGPQVTQRPSAANGALMGTMGRAPPTLAPLAPKAGAPADDSRQPNTARHQRVASTLSDGQPRSARPKPPKPVAAAANGGGGNARTPRGQPPKFVPKQPPSKAPMHRRQLSGQGTVLRLPPPTPGTGARGVAVIAKENNERAAAAQPAPAASKNSDKPAAKPAEPTPSAAPATSTQSEQPTTSENSAAARPAQSKSPERREGDQPESKADPLSGPPRSASASSDETTRVDDDRISESGERAPDDAPQQEAAHGEGASSDPQGDREAVSPAARDGPPPDAEPSSPTAQAGPVSPVAAAAGRPSSRSLSDRPSSRSSRRSSTLRTDDGASPLSTRRAGPDYSSDPDRGRDRSPSSHGESPREKSPAPIDNAEDGNDSEPPATAATAADGDASGPQVGDKPAIAPHADGDDANYELDEFD